MALTKATLVVFRYQEYHKQLLELVKRTSGRICFVTTNKGYDALIEMFNAAKIPVDNFYFIDCVTSTVVRAKKQKNCTFVSSPAALTELNTELNAELDRPNSKYDLVIFDSLSTLLVYREEEVVEHFVHHLINQMKIKSDVSLILTISEEDRETKLFKKIYVMVDNIKE